MSPQQTELARRLVGAKQWRWVNGMRAVEPADAPRGCIVDDPIKDEYEGLLNFYGSGETCHLDTALPVLDDWATAAILLRMASEAGQFIDHEVAETNGRPFWTWIHGPNDSEYRHIDLGTVAASALLAAWGE